MQIAVSEEALTLMITQHCRTIFSRTNTTVDFRSNVRRLKIVVFPKWNRNSVNLLNSTNLTKFMVHEQFKNPLCYPCLGSCVVTLWSATQEVASSTIE